MCRAASHLEHIIQFYSLLSTERTLKAEKYNFDQFTIREFYCSNFHHII